MQKYGIQRQHVHGYPDINIPGCEPWWADNHNGKSKKRARRIAKNEIMIEVCESKEIEGCR